MHRLMRTYRLRAKLTLEELSKRSGVSMGTIQHWEHGDGMLTLINVAAVCDVLGISIDEYVGRAAPKMLKVYGSELDEMMECAAKIAQICERTRVSKNEEM